MQRFFQSVIKRRQIIIIIFIVLACISGILMLGVGQNYDMSKYLPSHSDSKTGIDILKGEFSYNGSAVLLLEDIDIAQTQNIADDIEEMDGVDSVVWLNDMADIKQPAAHIGSDITDNYINGGDALLHIVFTYDDYHETTHQAIADIKALLGDNAALSGSAYDAYRNVSALGGNILTGIIIALLITLVILVLASDSYFEVLLFLVTIGVAILLNMGTNIIFGEISYMTFSSAAVLQLAISMDYSIFLLHRFSLERKSEPDPKRAMTKALRASFSSIMSSGMTTIVGFFALIFMSYRIGADMGLVLAKGIIFSLLCVMVLLPSLVVCSVKLIDKTTHKRLLPSLKKAEQVMSGKARHIILIILAAVAIVSFMAQRNNSYLYAAGSDGDEAQEAIDARIEEKFGFSNLFVVLVPRGSETKEYEMAAALEGVEHVRGVQGLYTWVDPAIPSEMVPDDVKNEFLSESYSRYIVDVDAPIESDAAMATVQTVRTCVAQWYDDAYVTGATPVTFDIKNETAGDFTLVTILSAVFVGIILLLTFRSLTLPLILLFVIETSIWINMAIPYFSGTPMVFIGYMVVNAVQLGATIDYAILMTNYYLEGRKLYDKRAAGVYATDKAGASILMSALVLAGAGFTVALTFEQQAMAELGTLIGRGALLSGALTIIVLPQLLILFDKVIKKTTMTRKRIERSDISET